MSSYSCAGVAASPLRRAWMLPTFSPAAALFYAGEIPAVSYPNSDGEELQVISFQREKAPDFRPKQRRKPGREKHNQLKPTKRQRGAFLDKCRGQKAQPLI